MSTGEVAVRSVRDGGLKREIMRVFDANLGVYGARKIWRQLRWDGVAVARCTVERPMREMGIADAVRGRRVRTTVPDPAAARSPDLVKRRFEAEAPTRLWVADFTYCATWSGMVYTTFAIDVFSRRIAGWRTSSSMTTDLPVDALEMTIRALNEQLDSLVHHSDRGSQHTAIRYTDRLIETGAKCPAGTTGDSYDNALAESVNGLYKTEIIRKRGPWLTADDIEIATLEWVGWYNNRLLHSSIGDIPPAEYEKKYYASQECA
jgi:putative transposase